MRLRQVIQFLIVSFLSAFGATHASFPLNLTEGVTPASHAIYDLHMTIFWICMVIGVVVFGIMLYAMLYHRKSQGRKAAHFHEHFWLEITWTIIPFIILIGMAIPATRVLINLNDTTQSDITIKVTGSQWKWHYDYLDQGIRFYSSLSTPYDQMHGKAPKNEYYLREVDHPIVVPIHKKIRFLITSNDVIHSWWVPDLGVKHDAVPGFIFETWTRINRPGIYRGQCSELCGLNHGFMPIVVIATTEQEFESWVAQQKGLTKPAPTTPIALKQPEQSAAPIAPPTDKSTLDDVMKRGEQIYLGTCAVCHKPDGTGSPPVFPALKEGKIATGSIDQHIDTVLNGKPGTAMQRFQDQFTDEELAAVITYERNAFGNHTGDLIQPAVIKAAREKGKKL